MQFLDLDSSSTVLLELDDNQSSIFISFDYPYIVRDRLEKTAEIRRSLLIDSYKEFSIVRRVEFPVER